MFEVHRGDRDNVTSQKWRQSLHTPAYRFQAVDHPSPAASTTAADYEAESWDINSRIQKLCTSLQTLLEKSRRSDRKTTRTHNTTTTSTTHRRLYPRPRDWGVSKAEHCTSGRQGGVVGNRECYNHVHIYVYFCHFVSLRSRQRRKSPWTTGSEAFFQNGLH